MKKMVFLLITLLVISGVVWGQAPGKGDGLADGNFDEIFNAVPTVSTESRYSAGIFGSDIDDYISVTDHDPKIGTFFFLGGYPSDGSTVDSTQAFNYVISAGFGKTFKAIYIGIYYGGNLVDSASGYSDGQDKEAKHSEAVWQNRLAVLVDPTVVKIGAFRFDLIMDGTTTEKDSYDGDIVLRTRNNSPAIALSWGGLKLGGFIPYFGFGYKFADLDITGQGDQQAIEEKGAALGVKAGGKYALNENANVSAYLTYVNRFADNYKYEGNGMPDPYKEFGGWNIGLELAYFQTIEIGKIGVGFKPAVELGFRRESQNSTADGAPDLPSLNYFEITAGVDLGIKYKHNNLLSFYTGASLTLLDWVRLSASGGDPAGKGSAWTFSGLAWDSSKNATGDHLGFGMTITPSPGLVIGTGLSVLLEKFFYIDLKNMQVGVGTFFEDSGANNIGDWATNVLRGVQFDLTISYKM